ncbi:hypothetical protein TNCV_4593911 [Trichonephila clavipes]|uniref:Uncharacterized protein n=1 Tax=Trichonephila clavipes TaxID=2585209 RepID=A0A8X7BKJ6_TRICX|nr:hypothetical protein TNCV_4593911 [Trichonephila clavipes]
MNLSQFDRLEIKEFEMQLIDFQSSSIRIQKFIETRKKLELIEAERSTSNIRINKNSIDSERLHLISDLRMNMKDDGLYADFRRQVFVDNRSMRSENSG